MKISLLCYDLGHNALGRAYLLAKVLQRIYEVEILGFHFPEFGKSIWPPCDTKEFDYKVFDGKKLPFFVEPLVRMLGNIKGDVIYASKLMLPSFGIGLLKKILNDIPIVLDVDDYEVSWRSHYSSFKKLISLPNPIGPLNTQFIEKFVNFADDMTSVSSQLIKLYGRGRIIPHGKDTDHLDPRKYDSKKAKIVFGLSNKKVILFLGTPAKHKGIEDIISALNLLSRDDTILVMTKNIVNPNYQKELIQKDGNKVFLIDPIHYPDIPKILCMADLVIVPQRMTLQSFGQIPAKIFDAMAMAKPIISTNVSDIPKILHGCGIIVEPSDAESLAEKIEWVFKHQDDALEMGRKARQKCIKKYSWDYMESELKTIFSKFE